jgi:hypothetical protein
LHRPIEFTRINGPSRCSEYGLEAGRLPKPVWVWIK